MKKTMAGKDLKLQELNELVRSLQDKGNLDRDKVKVLQNENDTESLTTMITEYLVETSNAMEELNMHLSEEEVDYSNIYYVADKIKEASLTIGASRMKDICVSLCGASGRNHKIQCIACSKGLNNEYKTLWVVLLKIQELVEAIHGKEE